MRRYSFVRRWSVVALLVAAFLVALAAPAFAIAEKDLPETYRLWLEEVAPIITKAEREAFLALEKDYQRDAFIERFWQVRDPYGDTARNELRESWSTRVAEAKQLFGSLDEERARFYLLNGAPAARIADECGVLLWPTEIWIYPPSERVREVLVLVFYQRFKQGKFRLWFPIDGVDALLQAPFPGASNQELMAEIANRCLRNDNFAAAIASVLNRGQIEYSILVGSAEKPIEGPSREWVSTFNSYSTDLPEAATELPAEMTIAYPGRRRTRTVVQATVAVPLLEAGVAELAGARSYNFLLNGEVLRGRRLFDSFRYKFDLPVAEISSESDSARLRALPAPRRLHADRQAGGSQRPAILPRRARDLGADGRRRCPAAAGSRRAPASWPRPTPRSPRSRPRSRSSDRAARCSPASSASTP